MTFFFEVSNPFNLRPWCFSSRLMFRAGFAWFAFGWFRIPFDEWGKQAWGWHPPAETFGGDS